MPRSARVLVFSMTALAVAAAGTVLTKAAPPSDAPPEQVRELVLSPAALPTPVLRLRLTPPVSEQTPGNAALLYFRAFLWLEQIAPGHREALARLESDYLATPLSDLPCEQVRRDLKPFQEVLALVEAASRCETCSWDPLLHAQTRPDRDRLTPELQVARRVTRILTARTRLEIAEGALDRAIVTLRTEYALARHVGQHPTVVMGLVGIGIRRIAHDTVETFIAAPDAPNLYWALTALPSPQSDCGQAMESEELDILSLFPMLRGVATAKHTPEQWQTIWKEFLQQVEAWDVPITDKKQGEADKKPEEVVPRDPQRLLEQAHPGACRRLIERGRPESQVGAMPAVQAVLIDAVETHQQLYQEAMRWMYVPFAVRAGRTDRDLAKWGEGLRFLISLSPLPALEACNTAVTISDRDVAALRCVEALRLYAHGHGGRLPESLDKIAEVPIPQNPVTGEPFPYKLEGEMALLDVAGPGNSAPWRWQITIRKPSAPPAPPAK